MVRIRKISKSTYRSIGKNRRSLSNTSYGSLLSDGYAGFEAMNFTQPIVRCRNEANLQNPKLPYQTLEQKGKHHIVARLRICILL